METVKPHAVCVPLPAQGHINPMLRLAKLLHSRGFHITFVHTEFNYRRLLAAGGGDSGSDFLAGLDDFKFEKVSDGLPADNPRGILDLPTLCQSMPTHCLQSFRDLIAWLNSSSSQQVPPVTCIVCDGVMGYTLEVAREFGIPATLFFTPSACGMLGYLHFEELMKRGIFPLKDEGCLINGYLDTEIDWIPAMKGIRLKDLPTFLRTTNPQDTMFIYNLEMVNKALTTGRLILNTFHDLEQQVLEAIQAKFPSLYAIGPLHMLQQQILEDEKKLGFIESDMWRKDLGCLEWLDERAPRSVVYVNYGSLVVMTGEQLREFAWGLANSKYSFMWVIRPDLVIGGEEIMSEEFMEEIKDRGLILEWCPQERVLGHSSVGGFLTHCGWNSVLESMGEGVPMICWPFFAEQQTNCFYLCGEWGVGVEIDTEVKRERVEGIVRELMEGEKGLEVREKAMEWKRKAQKATKPGGSSFDEFHKLVLQLRKAH